MLDEVRIVLGSNVRGSQADQITIDGFNRIDQFIRHGFDAPGQAGAEAKNQHAYNTTVEMVQYRSHIVMVPFVQDR
jgi:hypothetical protein